jgi:hypothetical protein
MTRRREPARSAREAERARVLKQWRGVDLPVDPNQNVTKAGDLLAGILSKLSLEDGIDENRLRTAWRDVAGDFVAGQTEPVSLRNRVLTLRVLQPSMRFHLEQSRAEILTRLQKALGRKKIREVRLTIG